MVLQSTESAYGVTEHRVVCMCVCVCVYVCVVYHQGCHSSGPVPPHPYSGGTVMLQWCHSGVMVVSP
jgi:hypothetical protein